MLTPIVTKHIHDQQQAQAHCPNHEWNERESLQSFLATREWLLLHTALQKTVRNEIKELENNLKPGECVFYMDWKEDVRLSYGPSQVSRYFTRS